MSFKRASTRYDNKNRRGGPLKKLYGRHMTTRDRRDEVGVSSNVGGIGEDPPKRNTSIPRVRASFFSTLEAGTTIGGGG